MNNSTKHSLIEIEYVEEENYIHLKTKDTYSAKDVDEFLSRVTEIAKKNDCTRILLDHRNCKFDASIFEIHHITTYLRRYGLDYQYKGAVVYNQDAEKYEFADTVTSNWSGGVLKFFDNYDSAKEWLLL